MILSTPEIIMAANTQLVILPHKQGSGKFIPVPRMKMRK